MKERKKARCQSCCNRCLCLCPTRFTGMHACMRACGFPRLDFSSQQALPLQHPTCFFLRSAFWHTPAAALRSAAGIVPPFCALDDAVRDSCSKAVTAWTWLDRRGLALSSPLSPCAPTNPRASNTKHTRSSRHESVREGQGRPAAELPGVTRFLSLDKCLTKS